MTILLADDDAIVRKLLAAVLRHEGYTVLEARNAKEALVLWQEHGNTIDVLVTDIDMPGMDGVALAESIWQTTPGLRVIYISGNHDQALARLHVAQGRAVLLAKPFGLDVFRRAVDSTMSEVE